MKNVENIKVSVIVPLFNACDFMDGCILSIRKQSHTNLEIILVNDGSTDETANKCEQYKKIDDRIIVISQINGGPGKARNYGLDVATGEFVCFVDSDDRLDEKAIEVMLCSLDSKCDMLQCRSQKMYQNGDIDNEIWKQEMLKIESIEAMRDYLYSAKPIVRFSVWAKLIRRSVIGDLRFPEMHNSEDVVFNAYLIDKCQSIQYIPEVLYLVTVRENSLSRGKLTRRKIESSLKCNEMIRELIESNNKYRHLINRVYWSSAVTMMTNACYIYLQRNEGWKNDIIYLQDNCKNMEIPHGILSVKQWGMICFFRKFPMLFVIVAKNMFQV